MLNLNNEWTCLNLILIQSIVNFRDIKIKILLIMNWSSQQYRALSDSTGVQAGPTPNWCQSPLLFGINTQCIFT